MPAPALLALASAVAPKLIDMISGTIDKVVPDKDLAEKIKQDITSQIIPYFTQLLESQRDIIVAEAKSDSWMARNWRPITMLTFVFIIANNYILYPYMSLFWAAAPTLELPDFMWELLKIGLGGYVVGRSGEKIMKAYKS